MIIYDVISETTNTKVGEFQSPMLPRAGEHLSVDVGKKYNNAFIVTRIVWTKSQYRSIGFEKLDATVFVKELP